MHKRTKYDPNNLTNWTIVGQLQIKPDSTSKRNHKLTLPKNIVKSYVVDIKILSGSKHSIIGLLLLLTINTKCFIKQIIDKCLDHRDSSFVETIFFLQSHSLETLSNTIDPLMEPHPSWNDL